MKKIISWIYKSKVDLSKKWWHRLFKVLFILATVVSVICLITFLSNSFTRVVHQWDYVDTLSSRLSKEPYSGKVVSIKDIYKENEVISEKYPSEMNFSLADKEYLQPFSPIFLEDSQSYCSDELYKQIGNVASTNNVRLFSTTDPTFERLYSNIDTFTTYLKNNSYSVKCVMKDSYTITNENDTESVYSFLRPIETSKYSIYSYKHNLAGFILYTLLSAVFLLFCIVCTVLIYFKIFLYIIYGKVENKSLEK